MKVERTVVALKGKIETFVDKSSANLTGGWYDNLIPL